MRIKYNRKKNCYYSSSEKAMTVLNVVIAFLLVILITVFLATISVFLIWR